MAVRVDCIVLDRRLRCAVHSADMTRGRCKGFFGTASLIQWRAFHERPIRQFAWHRPVLYCDGPCGAYRRITRDIPKQERYGPDIQPPHVPNKAWAAPRGSSMIKKSAFSKDLDLIF